MRNEQDMGKVDVEKSMTPAQRITDQIAEFNDWHGKTLAQLRALILEADPGITEEWKWGTAAWSQNGLVCSAAVFKNHVKLNFIKGASLEDPKGLFNAGFEGKSMRAIDFNEGNNIDEPALKELIRAAVGHNIAGSKKK